MKILSISHYDLDGFGCQLCINEKFKKHDITYSNCGYSSIEKTLDKFEFNNFDVVFITDLNFNQQQQTKLYEKAKDYQGKLIYIDHHQYLEGTEYLDKLADLGNKVIIDTTKSATLKTYEVLKLDNPNLKKLCELIDIYDMWRTENPKFKGANLFNTWFWENVNEFMFKMKQLDYDISKLKEEIKQQKNKVDNYYKENFNKIIFYKDPIYISFEYKYIGHIEEKFPGTKFAIILNIPDNRISIRDHLGIKDKMIEIAEKYNGTCGGHVEAYGMVIPDLKNKYQSVLKEIVEVAKNSLT